jgi:transcriptional regulator with XRE-family HTH domain
MANTKKAELKPTGLAKAAGISVPYASQILSGVKTPTQATAIRIFRATGRKFGPIARATPEEIEVLERFQGAA